MRKDARCLWPVLSLHEDEEALSLLQECSGEPRGGRQPRPSPVWPEGLAHGSLCQTLSLSSLGTLAEGLGLPGPHMLPRTPGLCGPQSPVLPLLFPALAPSPTSLLCLRVWGAGKVRLGGGGGRARCAHICSPSTPETREGETLVRPPRGWDCGLARLGSPAGTEAPAKPHAGRTQGAGHPVSSSGSARVLAEPFPCCSGQPAGSPCPCCIVLEWEKQQNGEGPRTL